MKVVVGNLLDLADNGEFEVIVHGCNCFKLMGAGIAGQISHRYPNAYTADKIYQPLGGGNKLGKYSYSIETNKLGKQFTIVNAYTQYQPGANISYPALEECFKRIKEDFSGKKIAYPRIGAGIAGGDWNVISEIIDRVLKNEDHTLVEYGLPSH